MHIEDSNGCCKDDVKLVKMQVDQAFAKLLTADFSIGLEAISNSEYHLAPLTNSITEEYPLSHGPPLSEQDTYLQNCVFRL